MKKASKILSLFFLLTLIGCTSDFDVFEEKASEYAKSDNTINSEELTDLKAIISEFLDQNDRAFERFLTNKSFDEQKLIAYLENKGFKVEKTPVVSSKSVAVNVYIENSGSMNGYINGNTEFKSAIQDMLVLLKYEYEEKNINLFFINSEIHPTNIDSDLAGFASALNAKSFKVGAVASSNLNNVFKQVLAKTAKDTISILISDCIYSIKGNKTEDLLSDQKSLTKDAFLTKSKEGMNLTTTVVKLNSKFNGNYWDKNEKATILNNKMRPYYISIIGSENIMNHFNSKIIFSKKEVAGYENKLVLSSVDYSKGIYFSVINAKNDLGKFKPARDFSDKNSIKGIEDVESDSRNGDKFTFSVALDLSKLPLEKSYITNPQNYTIDEGDFIISKISEFNKEDFVSSSVSSVLKSRKNPTHYITFSATSKKYSDLKFNLKRQLPKWVDETSTEDDTNIEAIGNKTFGFKYLMEGISEAYQTSSPSKNYFELTIKINN